MDDGPDRRSAAWWRARLIETGALKPGLGLPLSRYVVPDGVRVLRLDARSREIAAEHIAVGDYGKRELKLPMDQHFTKAERLRERVARNLRRRVK